MTAVLDNYPHDVLSRKLPTRGQVQTSIVEVVNRDALPEGAWDSHVHVVDEDRFPLHPSHPYRPKKADVGDLVRFEAGLGVSHVCLVAFSVYHTDNRSLIDALERLQGRARGVVCIDPDEITDQELLHMHQVGVRAIRLNLRTRGQTMDAQGFQETLIKNAERIRKFDWRIQLYVGMEQIPLIAPVIPHLGVTVIFDHLASPDPTSRMIPRLQPGYDEFMGLLRTGMVYTKLSGTYRFPQVPGVDEYIREILRVAPDRVIWASDWPHSGSVEANPGGDRTKVQEYRKIDDKAWVAKCKELCGHDEALIRKIWVDNPRRLWDYTSGL